MLGKGYAKVFQIFQLLGAIVFWGESAEQTITAHVLSVWGGTASLPPADPGVLVPASPSLSPSQQEEEFERCNVRVLFRFHGSENWSVAT